MSLEQSIEKLTAALEANTAALLASRAGSAVEVSVQSSTAKAEKSAKAEKAEKSETKKSAEKPADKSTKGKAAAKGEDDGFGGDEFTDEGSDDGFDDDSAGGEAKYTPEDAKAALLALRDAAKASKGTAEDAADHGKKIAKAVLAEVGLTSVNDIPADKADEVVTAALNHAVIAKCGPKFKELARAAGVAM